MKISILGAAGGVGRRLAAQATAAGHAVRGLVRSEAQADMLRLHGAEPVRGDLTADWESVLDGADAAVWAAGAGVAGDARAIDGDALIRVADTLLARGPRRLVVVSSMGVNRPEQMPPFLAGVLRIKAVSDAHVQASALDWTIVRPGGLSDAPGRARVQVAAQLPGGLIPRDDVASLVLACLEDPHTVGQVFEAVSGDQSIADALGSLPRRMR